tara:strand:- start:671 stop:1264 length:594 start_codon:yes stop_codon:yes gene_type:complete
MNQLGRVIKDVESKISADTILFFDMDGTLVHTDLANFLSYRKAIQTVLDEGVGLTYDPSQRFNRSSLLKILPDLSETDYRKIIKVKENCYNDFIQDTELNTTAVELLEKYSKTNQTILVTNCRKDRALLILGHYGLLETFSHTFFRELGDKKKVNKYVTVISRLGIPANSVVAFENEQSEIEDALIAGIPSQNIFLI